MLTDIKQFWLSDTDNETILEKDIIDAYSYSVKNNCIVISLKVSIQKKEALDSYGK